MVDEVQSQESEPQPFDAVVDEALGEASAPETPETPPEAAQPEATPPQPTAPPAEKFTYEGRAITVQDLQDGNLLREIITRANQTPHFANLYNDLLGQFRAQQAIPPQQPQQPQQPSGPTISPEMAMLNYKAQVDSLVKDGWIEEDAAEAFPRTMASFMYLKEQLTDTRMALANLLDQARSFVQQNVAQHISTQVDGLIGGLKSKGGIYTELGDPVKVQEFRNWMLSYQPTVGAMRDPEYLASQFFAFKQKDVAQAVQAGLEYDKRSRAESDKRRRQARGVTGGARPAGGPPDEARPWDALVDAQLGGG